MLLQFLSLGGIEILGVGNIISQKFSNDER